MIAMMQAADAGHSHDLGGPAGPAFDDPESRRLLLQGIVKAFVVVIRDVISNQPAEMEFQATTVSGYTTTSTLAHFDHQRRRPSQNRRSHGLNGGRGFLRLSTPTCCRKATSSSPRSCRERKKAPNQERKARRSRIMGPVYMTQSTGGRVPASDSFYEAIGYCGHTRLPGLGPFSESPHRTVVWEESLAWPLPCATAWQPAGKAGFKRYWFVPLSSETMIHFLICAGRSNRWPAILVNS